MNLVAPAFPDSDAFLRWNEGREGRREYVHGRVVEMMVGANKGHARRVRQLARAFEDRLDGTRYEVVTNDVGVRTPAGVRYPDILIDVTGGGDAELAATAPVVIVEVLSPSSLAIDLVEKADEYRALPSLLHYVVLSQNELRLWVWSRTDEGWRGPEMVEGADGVLALERLGVSLPVRDIYVIEVASPDHN
jgi:Uma2 family endonuclease